MLYGYLDVLSGTFPNAQRSFLISGEVMDDSYALVIQDNVDSFDDTLISYRFVGYHTPARLELVMLYSDNKNRQDSGTLTLYRTGNAYY
jgi:hypothetical protein